MSWLTNSGEGDLSREWGYADDVDFNHESQDELEALFPVLRSVLGGWDLVVNDAKTEFTHICADEENRGYEPWRNARLLGSLLCPSADCKQRMPISCVAFGNVWSLWMRGCKVPVKAIVRFFEALCTSVLTYNGGCSALTKNGGGEMDSLHRKKLRKVLGVKWPNRISNAKLHAQCCVTPHYVSI